jgi:hypothetical protein
MASIARYYTLTRSQINRLHYPTDFEGRLTRKRLGVIHGAGLINRTQMQVVNPSMGAPAYVYYPSAKGCTFLAQELKDDRYKKVCTLTPNWMHLYHWIAISHTHILLDQAVAKFPSVLVDDWISEWDTLNADEKEPEKKYRLYTKLGPKLVCAPDAAFLLAKGGFRKAFYIEQDRDTTKSADRVAAQKCFGYASLAENRVHISRHFPTATSEKFTVLFVTPSANRRDALKKAFATKRDAWLYRFTSQLELTDETFLTIPIWHPCEGEPVPLFKDGASLLLKEGAKS